MSAKLPYSLACLCGGRNVAPTSALKVKASKPGNNTTTRPTNAHSNAHQHQLISKNPASHFINVDIYQIIQDLFIQTSAPAKDGVHTVWYKCADLPTTTVSRSAPWDLAVLPHPMSRERGFVLLPWIPRRVVFLFARCNFGGVRNSAHRPQAAGLK